MRNIVGEYAGWVPLSQTSELVTLQRNQFVRTLDRSSGDVIRVRVSREWLKKNKANRQTA